LRITDKLKQWLNVEGDTNTLKVKTFTRQNGTPKHAPVDSKIAELVAIGVLDFNAAVRVTALSFGSSQRTVYRNGDMPRRNK
jgi:hypothetical protein